MNDVNTRVLFGGVGAADRGLRVPSSGARWRALLALGLLACGGPGGGGGGGDDELESATLQGLEESAVISEAELDELFPLVEEVAPVEDDAPSDPTQGGQLEARFAAYTPTRSSVGLFTIPAVEGVPDAFIATVTRGILFGLDNFEARLPGFSLYGAVAARPFVVHIFTEPRGELGFRPSVKSCPDPAAGWANCTPSVHVPYQPDTPVRAAAYLHEMGHLGHVYYTLSKGYTDAGGVVMGAFRHREFRWQREGSAQFILARGPDWAAYDRLGGTECAFRALQQGAFAWRDFAPTGNAMRFPYQMSLLVDQVSWHHFAGGTEWLLDWWIARPDGRNSVRPESAARSLMRLLSRSGSSVDLRPLNELLIRAGVDLYARGRNPWTTRALHAECYDTAPTALTAAAAGSATISVPPVAFRAVRMPIAAGALDDLKTLELKLTSDRPGVRAAVYAVDVANYVSCVTALTGSALGEESPRKTCNATHVLALGSLTSANGYRSTVKLTDDLKTKLSTKEIVAVLFHVYVSGGAKTPAPITFTAGPPTPLDLTITFRNSSSEEHVHFYVVDPPGSITVDSGSSGTIVVPGVQPGDKLTFRAEKPSDAGPVSAGERICEVSENPSNPTVKYSGTLSCSGF